MRVLFVFVFSLISFSALAQYDFTKAVITLNTGETLEGEAKLIRKGNGYNTTVSSLTFRKKRGKGKKKYSSNDVDFVIFTNTYTQEIDGVEVEKTSFDRYVSVDTKRYDKRIFLQEVLKDKLSVYGMPVNNYKEGINSDVSPYDSGIFTLIYIKKADASAMMITVLGLEGFIQEQRAADYLSNCPMTIEHMRSKEGSINPVELANFYNANCD